MKYLLKYLQNYFIKKQKYYCAGLIRDIRKELKYI